MSIRQFFARDLKLRHLRLLVAIDDAGQLSRVARLMHVTQSALSKSLAEIERAIGEPLFERTGSGLVANPRGATLVRAARTVLAELDRAGGELESASSGPERVLHVGAMPLSPLAFLASALALLGRTDPALSVRVVEGQSEALLTQMVAGRLDLVAGARVRRTLPDGIDAVRLHDDPLIVVAASGHPLAARGRATWDDCVDQAWVLPPAGHPTRRGFERALGRLGLRGPRRVTEALSSDVTLGLLRHGRALGLVPQRHARALSGPGLMRGVAPAVSAMLDLSMEVNAYVPSHRAQSAEIRALLACLREASGLGA
jgi:DNA-binding transcriptional LysR family regulator